MSFFFALNLNNFNNLITIPKFTNEGTKLKGLSLFSAKIKKNKWHIRKQVCREDDYFFYLEVLPRDLEDIFFLNNSSFCNNRELTVKELKIFYDVKSNYSFRANLKIKNDKYGSSSYQSEYPIEMIYKKGSILSTVSSLTNDANSNFIAFKQIYYLPTKKPFQVFLVDLKKEEILSKTIFYSNSTNIIELSKVKDIKNCCFYSDEFLGIPIFISYGDKGVSMEHSHPPHLYIQSNNKFKLVTNLKNKVKKIVSK